MKRFKSILSLIILLVVIWVLIYFLVKSIDVFKDKYRYYKISNQKYETLYLKRRTDILSIDYKQAIDNANKYLIVDTREPEEYEVWHIPWVENIRVWDLIWDEQVKQSFIDMVKSTDKKVLLLCHDWDRSIEVGSYFKDKYDIDVGYITNWIEDIKDDKLYGWWLFKKFDTKYWSWDFEIVFQYDNQFTILKKEQVKADYILNISYDMHNENREDSYCNYNAQDEIVQKSIYAPIRNMPTYEIKILLEKIWTGSVATICYSRSTCFFSKVLWYRITSQWWKFNWIYVIQWSNCVDTEKDVKNGFKWF